VLYAASVTDAGQKEVPSATAIDIDATPPRLACPRRAPAFVQGSTGASVTATVTDATSGPVSRTVSVPASVATAGIKRAALTGSDEAGNTAAIRCPYRVLGHISPSMFWSFTSGASFTTVNSLVGDDVPVGARVRLLCRGSGCPRVTRTLQVSVHPACRTGRCNARGRRPGTSTIDLTPLLRGRHLRPATVLTVAMTARNAIGKAFVFTIRSGRDPKVVIGCLAPGSVVPGRGC
jgi:hypothetical protein